MWVNCNTEGMLQKVGEFHSALKVFAVCYNQPIVRIYCHFINFSGILCEYIECRLRKSTFGDTVNTSKHQTVLICDQES